MSGLPIIRGIVGSPDYWAFHSTTELCTRLLSFAPNDWALHPTTGLFIQLLGFEPEYWASTRILGFCLNTGLLSEYWVFTQLPKSNFLFLLRWSPKSKRTRPCGQLSLATFHKEPPKTVLVTVSLLGMPHRCPIEHSRRCMAAARG